MNANAVLDNFAYKVRSTPQGTSLANPWNGILLNDDAQAAAAALIDIGAIGLFGTEGKYKLYAFRSLAGYPFARVLSGAVMYIFSIFFLSAVAALGWAGKGSGVGAANLGGIVLSVLGMAYFGLHAANTCPNSWLLKGIGTGQLMRMGSSFLAVATAVPALIAFVHRVL
ncbi:TPA: hypothetical protein ACRL4E_001931 [Pseudomonas aeruginosa]|uniref:hypothetical protein n=1 Tax=Pseudomonas nitroreducens TaxID=46680 RepID=UPI002F350A4B